MDHVDWAETPIYKAWEIEGPKWRLKDPSIFSDTECKQLYSLFKEMRGTESTLKDLKEKQEELVR